MLRDCKWMTAVVWAGVLATAAAAGPSRADEPHSKDKPAGPGDEVAERPGEYCGICAPRETSHPLGDLDFFDLGFRHVDWIKVGGDVRLRQIYDNNLALDKNSPGSERLWQRYRGRFSATIAPAKNIDVTARIAWEFRNYIKPKGGAGDYSRDFDLDEAIIDVLNVQLTDPLNLPMRLTVGRQEMRLGDGWLVFEGTPLDGSRTIFFDAIRATVDLAERRSIFDVIFIDQQADSDRLTPIDDRERVLTNQNERGLIVYPEVPSESTIHFFISVCFRLELAEITPHHV